MFSNKKSVNILLLVMVVLFIFYPMRIHAATFFDPIVNSMTIAENMPSNTLIGAIQADFIAPSEVTILQGS